MAMKGEIKIKNHEGVQLEGPRENGSSLIFQFLFDVKLPMDDDTSKISGSRKIGFFEVTKDIDQLTPQLYEMVCLGRTCKEIEVTLFKIDDEGDEKPYFRYLLEDAKFGKVENLMPTTKDEKNDNVGHLEVLKFNAKKFTWEYLEGGIIYQEKLF